MEPRACALSSASLSSRCQRFRIACSVRLGSRSLIFAQRWPNSRTQLVMTASSLFVQLIRFSSAPFARLGGRAATSGCEPTLLAPQGGGQSGGGEPAAPPPRLPGTFAAAPPAALRRDQRLRTASSERWGSCEAMKRHLAPWSATPCRIVSSSSCRHSSLGVWAVMLGECSPASRPNAPRAAATLIPNAFWKLWKPAGPSERRPAAPATAPALRWPIAGTQPSGKPTGWVGAPPSGAWMGWPVAACCRMAL
mmetsp:Transcript_22208/g.70999  ORF Transcript_22208/g.70999 Transcript_22208/m.70999 type:complete len:251 (+) Transcript_22208:322-1074(+)